MRSRDVFRARSRVIRADRPQARGFCPQRFHPAEGSVVLVVADDVVHVPLVEVVRLERIVDQVRPFHVPRSVKAFHAGQLFGGPHALVQQTPGLLGIGLAVPLQRLAQVLLRPPDGRLELGDPRLDVEVVDVRPLKTPVAGLTFVQDDGTTLASVPDPSVPSLSSLPAVEHFGLGRYGDPIDPGGAAEALRTFERVLAPGGTLYLSFPIGRPRVEFNAHRIFDPRDPIEVLGGLTLVRFSAVDDGGVLRDPCQPEDLQGADYALGIYEFARRP